MLFYINIVVEILYACVTFYLQQSDGHSTKYASKRAFKNNSLGYYL